jgi:hypothetical protein
MDGTLRRSLSGASVGRAPRLRRVRSGRTQHVDWLHDHERNNSLTSTEHSFLIRRNTQQTRRTHAPLMSNVSNQNTRCFAIIRRRLTSNDALPPLKACEIAWVVHSLNVRSVAHHKPELSVLIWHFGSSHLYSRAEPKHTIAFCDASCPLPACQV